MNGASPGSNSTASTARLLLGVGQLLDVFQRLAIQPSSARCRKTGGVSVVVQTAGAEPDFLASNPGGRFKGRDPTIDVSALEANWVDDAEVVYIGKADKLRQRRRQFAQFGAGKPIGHWGGRLIWQLSRSSELLVAWRETPDEIPKEAETRMLAEFRAVYGQPPFADNPHLLGQ